MEAKIAEQYPLFKDFDFISEMGGRAGSGILLIPKKQLYVPKEYGFDCLHLVPYLQEPFNDGESMQVSDLIRELQEEGELSLGNLDLDRMLERTPFLYTVLNRFRKHDIVALEKRAGSENIIDAQDILIAGENYDKTRVLKLEGYAQGSDERFGVDNPFPSFFS